MTPRPTAVLVSVLEFTDGTASASRLAQGSPDECDFVATSIPAVAYSGAKEIDRSYLSIWPWEQWQDWLKEESDGRS
jgi:hypothetical protein